MENRADQALNSEFERIDLGEESWVDYHPTWLPSEEQARFHQLLVGETAWEARAINIFGKSVMQPRLIGWAGSVHYRYSGQTLEPRVWGPNLSALLDRVCRDTGLVFNHALLNRYRNGRDNMGMHADDERELGWEPTIAAVSLGVRRRFVLASKKRKRQRVSIWLEPGSLMVMCGRTQHRFRHGVPRQDRLQEERINVTFRMLVRPPPRRLWAPPAAAPGG